jgi:uncharacterized protein YjbI with pentapeptide repeats
MTNKSREQEGDFTKMLSEEIERIRNDNQTNVFDFTRFVFPSLNGLFYFNELTTHFTKPVIFDSARFAGGADFSGSEFEEDADFFKTVFGGMEKYAGYANFDKTTFKKKASFWATDFRGGAESLPGAQFANVNFVGDARFNSSSFKNWATFNRSTFAETADFSKTQFGGKADFNKVTFLKEVKFKESAFVSADFTHTKFCQAAEFIGTKFPNRIVPNENSINLVTGIFFRDVDFLEPETVQFRGIGLSQIDLKGISFLSTDIKNVIFVEEKWGTKPVLFGMRQRRCVLDEDLIEGSHRYESHPLGYLLPTYEKVKQVYRRLRKNYEVAGRYAEAGDFYVGEMEMRRLDVGLKKRPLRWLAQNVSPIAIYKYLSLYGESFSRLLVWAIVVILTFSAIRLLSSVSESESMTFSAVLNEIGHSVAAFFQLPVTDSKLDVVERILSAPILGLLLVSLKRNYERK